MADGDLVQRFGSSKHPQRAVARERVAGLTDETVTALGKLSEALETAENARGLLYEFHRLCGRADLTLQEAVELLRGCGQPELAAEIDQVLVGRDVVRDMWSFELVEAYDAQYWSVFRAVDAHARELLGGVECHVYEAEMKRDEQR